MATEKDFKEAKVRQILFESVYEDLIGPSEENEEITDVLATTVDFLKESGQALLTMTGPPLRCHPWHLSANANIVFALPLRLNHFPRKSHSLRRIYVRGSSPFLLGYEKHPNYLGRAF